MPAVQSARVAQWNFVILKFARHRASLQLILNPVAIGPGSVFVDSRCKNPRNLVATLLEPTAATADASGF
jgi:hypothetical protein